MARRGRTRRPTAGVAEASAAAPPLAMTVLLAVSLAAAAIEIDSLCLVTGKTFCAVSVTGRGVFKTHPPYLPG